MRILIIKMTSLGDVIHAIPAVRALKAAFPQATIDWVIEDSFQDLLARELCINKIIPVSVRRWRKTIFSRRTWQEYNAFKKALREKQYDFVIDAQGLFKSAYITMLAKGKTKIGFDWQSAREPFASHFYDKKISVDKSLHAILRQHQLFSRAFDGKVAEDSIGVHNSIDTLHARVMDQHKSQKLLLIHATTWATKHWSEKNWQALAAIAIASGFEVRLPWGNEQERQRAEKIAEGLAGCIVLPKMSLSACREEILGAKAVIAVDTGLAHWAATLGIPSVSLYGPTDPHLTGTRGHAQCHLVGDLPCAPCRQENCRIEPAFKNAAPCMQKIEPEEVWQKLKDVMAIRKEID